MLFCFRAWTYQASVELGVGNRAWSDDITTCCHPGPVQKEGEGQGEEMTVGRDSVGLLLLLFFQTTEKWLRGVTGMRFSWGWSIWEKKILKIKWNWLPLRFAEIGLEPNLQFRLLDHANGATEGELILMKACVLFAHMWPRIFIRQSILLSLQELIAQKDTSPFFGNPIM